MERLPLHLRRQVYLSSYISKIIKGQGPSNFNNIYSYISGGSRDETNCNLYTPKSKNLKIFYCLGAKAWNHAPSNLRDMSDSNSFNKNYKTQLLDSIVNDSAYTCS